MLHGGTMYDEESIKSLSDEDIDKLHDLTKLEQRRRYAAAWEFRSNIDSSKLNTTHITEELLLSGIVGHYLRSPTGVMYRVKSCTPSQVHENGQLVFHLKTEEYLYKNELLIATGKKNPGIPHIQWVEFKDIDYILNKELLEMPS